MTTQKILEKAIQKAIDGGWKPFINMTVKSMVVETWEDGGLVQVAVIQSDIIGDHIKWVRELEGIIFNHDFAKALWGGENWEHKIEYTMKIGRRTETIVSQPWLYHLQQMVIAEDPIAYLGENI